MKKLNLALLGACLFVAGSAIADTTIPWTKEGCESVKGTWITANSATDSGCDAAHCNGKNFCKSNADMHWFSALIWCKAIGHKLVNFATLCPGTLSENGQSCANANGISNSYGWIALPKNNTESLCIWLPSGQIRQCGRQMKGGSGFWAICEE